MAKQVAKSASAQNLASGKKTSSDTFVQIAQEVETLNQKKAFELVDALISAGGESEFKLGGALAVISDKAKAEGSSEEWLAGYQGFKDLCEKRFNFSYRKAMYLIDIYKHLVEQQIPWTQVKDLGWTKLSILASKKELNAKNVEKWVKKAEKLTVEQLKDVLKSGDVTSKAGTLTVKVQHEDQKEAIRQALDKAKKESNTEYDAVALHNIAQAYLGNAIEMELAGEAPVEKPKQKTKLKEYWAERLGAFFKEIGEDFGDADDGPAIVLNTFEQQWPKITVKVEFPA